MVYGPVKVVSVGQLWAMTQLLFGQSALDLVVNGTHKHPRMFVQSSTTKYNTVGGPLGLDWVSVALKFNTVRFIVQSNRY